MNEDFLRSVVMIGIFVCFVLVEAFVSKSLGQSIFTSICTIIVIFAIDGMIIDYLRKINMENQDD